MQQHHYHQCLAGLTVVALEQAVAAPYCSSRLADAGARVIKIERPEGDFARAYDTAAGGESAYFVWLNRGKESIALDLKTEDDQALAHRLVSSADVFIQNLSPGAAARLGLGSEFLRAANPQLITVNISGYGDAPSMAKMKAYDLLVQCETGLASITGSPADAGRVGISVCDIATGMHAHSAILQALISRSVTGQGCAIDVSLFDSMADWMSVPLMQFEGGLAVQRVGLNHPTIAPYGGYTCADQTVIVFSVQNEREWRRFCHTVLAQPELIEQARFANNASRIKHRGELDSIINQHFGQLDATAIQARLESADIAFGRVRDLKGLQLHPALRRMVQPLGHGEVMGVPPAAQVDRTEFAAAPVPKLNEQGAQIRREFAPVNKQ